MVMWEVEYTKQAIKDIKLIKQAGLTNAAKELIKILKVNPFQNPPPYEKLIGDLNGAYSRRINIKHRLVYSVAKKGRCVRVLRLWSHYE